jgi:hypothetical protein
MTGEDEDEEEGKTLKGLLPYPVHVAAKPRESSDTNDQGPEPRYQPSTIAELEGVREAEGFFTVHFCSISCPQNVKANSMKKDPDNHLHSDPSAHD